MTDDSKWKDMVALETMLATISGSVGTLHMEVNRLDGLATEVTDTLTMGILEGKTFENALAEVDVSPNEFCATFDTMAWMCEHLATKAREFTATFVEDMGAKPCMDAATAAAVARAGMPPKGYEEVAKDCLIDKLRDNITDLWQSSESPEGKGSPLYLHEALCMTREEWEVWIKGRKG